VRSKTPESLEYDGMPGDDELGGERSLWRALSTRQLVTFLAVAAVAVALVVGGHFGAGSPKAAPTPQPTNTDDGTYGHFRPLSLDEIALHCPPTILCTLRDSVPDNTIAAVHEYLPGSFDRRILTIDRINPNGLYYRAMNATAGLVELLVIISTPDRSRGAQAVALDPHPGAAIRYARRVVGSYEVQVQYTGPPGSTPPLDLAERLAADPRLLADS
jgi:hypothetical protein